MRAVVAFARFRYLLSTRSAGAAGMWVALLMLILLGLPAAGVSFSELSNSDRSGVEIWQSDRLTHFSAYGSYFDQDWPDVVAARGFGLAVILYSHVFGLLACAAAFACSGAQFDEGTIDPFSLAPLDAAQFFFGNALGLGVSVLQMHATILPVIVVFECLSPLSHRAFWCIEAALVTLIAFASIAGAWAMQQSTTGTAIGRVLRAAAIVPLLAGFTVAATTRSWKQTLDLLLWFFRTPTRDTAVALWRSAAPSIPWLILLVIMVVAYFCWSAVRPKFDPRRSVDAVHAV
jgi:hypothetical protein